MNEMQATQLQERPRNWKAVYTIVDRGGEKKFWIRIGTAFVNHDGSLNVRLDAAPTNGQLHIRDAEPFNPAARRGSPSQEAAFGGAEALS